MKIDTKFCFVLFYIVFEEILCSATVAAEKATRFCLEFTCFFSFVYSICVGIPILKIVLSHAHKRVISDVTSLEIKFSLAMNSPGGPGMVNGKTLSQNAI